MCNHRPREIFRAMSLGDEVLTCRKCGEVIVGKDPDQRRMFSVLSLIPVLVLSTIFRTLFLLFFPCGCEHTALCGMRRSVDWLQLVYLCDADCRI